MKKAALIILLLLMLGGCGNNSELSTETVSETLPTSSVTTNAETEDTAATVTTTEASATTAAETAVTEETTTEETTAVTEPKPPEPVIPPDVMTIDLGKAYEGEKYYIDCTILDDENILVLYQFHNGIGGFVKCHAAAAKIFGISDGEEKAHIDIPLTNADFCTVESAEWYNLYRSRNNSSDDVCCAIYSCENGGNCTTETVIYNDFTYESKEFGDRLSYYGSVIRTAGDHMAIISRYDNFYDTESGEIILNSIYEGDESKSTYRCGYEFPIDENSFVYHMWGYEWSHCFGIYDYTTGLARNVPNTVDAHPIAAHNGKIYSYYGDPDYTEYVIYATDVKTLEKTPLFKLDENDDPGDYRMPPSGEFLYKCYSNSFTVYDPDNLNIIKKYEFENTYIRNWDVRFTEDDRAILLDEKQKCLYILELNK